MRGRMKGKELIDRIIGYYDYVRSQENHRVHFDGDYWHGKITKHQVTAMYLEIGGKPIKFSRELIVSSNNSGTSLFKLDFKFRWSEDGTEFEMWNGDWNKIEEHGKMTVQTMNWMKFLDEKIDDE